MSGISYCNTGSSVFAFVQHRSVIIMIVSMSVENNFKGHGSIHTPLSEDNKQLRCYNEMVSRAIV